MNIQNQELKIYYQTAQEECPCCYRPFESLEFGKEEEFNVQTKAIFEWADWTELDHIYEEEIDSSIEEYLISTIGFYRASNKIVRITPGSLEKLISIVRTEIKRLQEGDFK